MPITRQRFNLRGAVGGTWSDTGPQLSGELIQVRYLADGSNPLDTGANIELFAVTTSRNQATGAEALVARSIMPATIDLKLLNSGSHWNAYPNDTGSGRAQAPVLAGEQLRVLVTQDSGAAGVRAGTLLAYVRS